MTAETLTLTAAALARPLGYTIRREPEAGEIVAYAKGTGKNAPHAYFTDCPIDALATVCAMAADSADPEALAAAHAACGVPMTRAADPLGEIVAECDRMAADTPREEAQPETREERRAAGHAAELAADSAENPAERAAHYDRAAELFETLGGFHYPARARGLREEAKKARAVSEYLAEKAPEEAQPEPRESFVIDATPTWASLAPAFVMALQNGTPEGQKIAREEMARGFAALDAHNAHAREMGEAVKAVCILLETALANSAERPARINSALDSDDLAQTIAAALDCLKAHAA